MHESRPPGKSNSRRRRRSPLQLAFASLLEEDLRLQKQRLARVQKARREKEELLYEQGVFLRNRLTPEELARLEPYISNLNIDTDGGCIDGKVIQILNALPAAPQQVKQGSLQPEFLGGNAWEHPNFPLSAQ